MADEAPAPTLPQFSDFSGAEVVGGAVVLDGKNMGTLTASGVEVSPVGQMYLDTKAAPAPEPVPLGVIDPAAMAPVQLPAKRAVRKRKQNEAAVDAMNAPTAEEETVLAAEDAPPAAEPPAEPPAAA
jgi:hypothetical protein